MDRRIDLTIEIWERLLWIKPRNTYRNHFLSVITDSIYPEYFCSTFLLNRHLLIMGIQMVVYYLEKLYWQRDQPHNVSGMPFHC